jgi:hypothetical protein
MIPVAVRTSPETETPLFRHNLSEIHGRPIMATTNLGRYFLLISISVLVGDEVSARSIIVDYAIALWTSVGKCQRPLGAGLQDNLAKRHFDVMLVAKSGKVPFHLDTEHTTSFQTAGRELLRESLR